VAEKTARLQWIGVDSTNVDAVAFDELTQTIVVRFLGGGLYSYTYMGHDLKPAEVFVDLSHAVSVGQYLDRVIKKGNFAYKAWFSEDELLNNL
jgi:hypothetical protein